MPERPNILFIMTDQQRLDSIGAYGSHYGASPNLDALASESVVFDAHYTSCPLCVPARCSLATGRYPHTNGALVNAFSPDADPTSGRLGPDERTLFEHPAELGYVQYHVGIHHVRTDPELRDRVSFAQFTSRDAYCQYLAAKGLVPYDHRPYQARVMERARDHVYPSLFSAPWPGRHPLAVEDYQDMFFARQAVDALECVPTDSPWAVFCYFWAPHPPFVAPEPYYSLYDPRDIELPPNTMAPLHIPRHMDHLPGAVACQQPNLSDWRLSWAVYLGMVRLVDDCVGQVLAALSAREDADRTLTVFTTDHGEQLGAHSLFQKMNLYQESVHVPFLLRVPGARPGRRAAITSHVDIMPTILDHAGTKPPASVAGTSLRRLVDDAGSPHRDVAYIEYNGNVAITVPQRAIVEPPHKLIYTEGPYLELYDIDQDPYEMDDLAGQPAHAKEYRRLRQRLDRWMLETGDWVLPRIGEQ